MTPSRAWRDGPCPVRAPAPDHAPGGHFLKHVRGPEGRTLSTRPAAGIALVQAVAAVPKIMMFTGHESPNMTVAAIRMAERASAPHLSGRS